MPICRHTRPITSPSDEFLIKGIQEARSTRYKDDAPRHHWKDTTIPAYDGWSDDGKYSWVKSPTFYGKTVEIRAAGEHAVNWLRVVNPRRPNSNEIVCALSEADRQNAGNGATSHSLRWVVSSGVPFTVVNCKSILQDQYNALIVEKYRQGDYTTFVKPNIPATGGFKGDRLLLEAPRGMLSLDGD